MKILLWNPQLLLCEWFFYPVSCLSMAGLVVFLPAAECLDVLRCLA